MTTTPARILRMVLACVLSISVSFGTKATAQNPNDGDIDIVERIQQESNGNVEIEIPASILELILKKDSPKPSHEIRPGINKLSGFRIQVFSDGRNQHTLEARAKARGSAILARFPKYRGQIYTYSHSPNWYTRIGNLRTNTEANHALDELKRAFPNYASEMRVVKCQIVVIKQ